MSNPTRDPRLNNNRNSNFISNSSDESPDFWPAYPVKSRELARILGRTEKYAYKTFEKMARQGRIRGHKYPGGGKRAPWWFFVPEVMEDLKKGSR